MRTIIFATGNQGKLVEIREILRPLSVTVLSMSDAGISCDINENGTTFAENAMIKAGTIAKALPDRYRDAIVMADDSGLEVDAMDKLPGVYSARWMGRDTSYRIKNAKIIENLKDVPVEKRTARFVCAIAAVLPDGRTLETLSLIHI